MKIPAIVAALGLTSTVSACILEHERHAERSYVATGQRPDYVAPLRPRQGGSSFPIGKGDRFGGGCKAPVGLGVQDRDLKSVLSVKEVDSALKGLANVYPDQVKLFKPPFETYEGRDFPAAVVGDNPRVFIMSGIHARERGGPDAVIYFLSDLLAASKAGTGVSYAGKEYTAEDVQTALSAGIVVVPLTNPDGVNWDQTTDTCWRKNRNPESSTGSERSIGIDLNRNYDFAWDYKTAFDPTLPDSPASDDPASEVFYGTGVASEPETQAIVWSLDQYQNVTWMVDLHSYGPSLLYAWGDDDPGFNSTKQNFENPAFDGKRGVVSDTLYREYFSPEDYEIEKEGAGRMVDAMLAAGDAPYEYYHAVGLYPTSGASNDYAMGRYYGKLSCTASRMFGMTLEFGEASEADPSCPFYPSSEEFHRNIRQVSAGFMEMMLVAAGEAGEPLYPEC